MKRLLALAFCLFVGAANAQSIPFPGPGMSSAPASASLTYQAFATEGAGGSTVSYAGVSVGAAAANRLIVVVFATRSSTASTMSAASICGTSATRVTGAGASVANNAVYSDIWYVSDTVSTSCAVSGTWSSATMATGIQVYNVITTNSTPSAGASGTNGATNSSVSASLSVPSNGVGLVGVAIQGPNSPSFTNATLDNNGAITGGRGLLAGHTTAIGSITITGSNGTNSGMSLSAASWGP